MNPYTNSVLRHYLLSRRWLRRSWPFPHVVAYDVFVPGVYQALVGRVRQSLRGLGNHSYLDGHDIFGTTVTPDIAVGLEPLTLRAWHDFLAELTGVHATGHVALGIHHHRVGSANGFPHNDLNLGWFASDPTVNAIELSRPEAVEYTTGVARAAGIIPRETVRAIAALFYLDNGSWQQGDGGATGLYARGTDPTNKPALIVPPLDNSLLIFECTPTSWHGFISNRRHPRNSIIMWLHRPKNEVVARWGADAIVAYGRRPAPEVGL